METKICVIEDQNQVTEPKASTTTDTFQYFYSVDSFANGIAFGQQKLPDGADRRDYFTLRLRDDTELIRLRSRYCLHKENPLYELELHLMRLSRQGILSRSVIYFGTTTDPFFPFEGKFDASMKFLELFKRYTPGQLIVQTRSPLLVIAMPVLKKLGQHVSVTLGVETNIDEVSRRYTPTLPRVSERLQCARALRRFGVEVTLQVAPVLPYGDWRKDADHFAETLIDAADFIHVRPLCSNSSKEDRRVIAPEIAKALSLERKFHWLRPDSADPLIHSIQLRAPEKLVVKHPKHLSSKQMEMFAA